MEEELNADMRLLLFLSDFLFSREPVLPAALYSVYVVTLRSLTLQHRINKRSSGEHPGNLGPFRENLVGVLPVRQAEGLL